MGSDSSSNDTQSNYEREAFGGVGNNWGYTAPGNNRSNNPTDSGRGYVSFPDTGGNDNDGPSQPAGPSQAEIDLSNARDRRKAALAKKQKELSDAFGFFNDDFYGDMSQSYKDFAQTSLDGAFDDSVRGIYQGFKSRGLLTQEGVNEAMAGLNQVKNTEMQRLDQLAGDYATAKRKEVDTGRQKFGDELSSLVGGATDAESVNRQVEAIEGFDVAGRVDKLKKPGAKKAVDFFQGYDKVKAAAPGSGMGNVDASAAPDTVGDGGGSASSVVQMGANTSPSSLVGIRSPFQGGSTKVVS